MGLLAIIILIMARQSKAGVPNPEYTAEDQYATVLVSNQYVPTQTIPSPFFGLFYASVETLDKINKTTYTYTMTTLLWHNVAFATNIVIGGAVPAGQTGVVLFTLSGVGVASSIYCPFQSSYNVSQQFVDALRQGLIYVEISSDGQPTGQLRGQIVRRSDVYFAPLREGTVGLAIAKLYNITDPFFAGMDFWMLSIVGLGSQFVGVSAQTGNINLTLGIMPPPPPIVASLFFVNQYAVERDVMIVKTPLYGPGSSLLEVGYLNEANAQNPVTIVILGEFMRLPDQNSVDISSRKGGGGQKKLNKEAKNSAASPHFSATNLTPLSFSLLASLTLFLALAIF
jgi:hypothetical protein